MTKAEAANRIRFEMAQAASPEVYAFWKGVLVGLACGENINMALLKDFGDKQGLQREPLMVL